VGLAIPQSLAAGLPSSTVLFPIRYPQDPRISQKIAVTKVRHQHDALIASRNETLSAHLLPSIRPITKGEIHIPIICFSPRSRNLSQVGEESGRMHDWPGLFRGILIYLT
jgi:hypothetical protein